jgi:FAD/FMN-containing dehydrogenase
MSSTSRWGELQAAVAGEVVLPDSPGYDLAYRALNARFDHVRHQAVVRCEGPHDVSESIRFARQLGMAVATRGGGHCFGGRSSTGGLLVDVTPMHAVEVAGGTVTVGGGTRLGEVYGALLDHDLAIAAGSCPSVGIAGQALGGGLGIIGRKYGLMSDHLLGVQIVLADGRILKCDDHDGEDLFWALRGGGPGNFGVVTALTFRTIRAPGATNFHLSWPFSTAAAVIEAWMSWAPIAPEELAASLVIGASAKVDEPPSVGVFGVMLGTESDTDELVGQLVGRARSEPASAFRQHMSFRETARYWGERASRDRVEGTPPGQELRGYRFIKSEFFKRPLSAEVIDALQKLPHTHHAPQLVERCRCKRALVRVDPDRHTHPGLLPSAHLRCDQREDNQALGESPLYRVTSASPVPAGGTVRSLVRARVATTRNFGVTSGRLPVLSARRRVHGRILTPGISRNDAGHGVAPIAL